MWRRFALVLIVGLLASMAFTQPEVLPPTVQQETDIARLTQRLKEGNEQTRLEVVKRLQQIGGVQIIDPLLLALGDENVEVRIAAAQAFRNVLAPRVISALITALHDPDSKLRQAAIRSLQNSKNETTTTALLPLLDDPAPEVRLAAAQSLSNRDDERVAPALIPLAGDPDARMRVTAMRHLGKYGTDGALEVILHAASDPDAGVRKAALDAMSAQYHRVNREECERVVAALIGFLKDQDGDIHWEAVNSLGACSEPQAIDALIDAMLHDPKPEIREFTARALRRIGDDRAVEPLIQAIHDPVEKVRSAAKSELGRIGDARAIPALLAIKDAGDERDRECTAGALARLGVTEGMLTPKGFTTAEWVVVAPVFGGDWLLKDELLALQARKPALVEILQAFLGRIAIEGGDQNAVLTAMDALVKLNTPGTADVLAALYQKMHNKMAGDWLIAEMLGRLGDPQAAGPLIDLMQQRLRFGGDNGVVIRLGRYDDPRIPALLEPLRESDAMDMKYAVAGALARHGDEQAMTFLLRPFDQLVQVDQLGQPEKLYAIAALGQTGDPRALDIILGELGQDDDSVRFVTADALATWFTINTDRAAYDRTAPVLVRAVATERNEEWRLKLLQPLLARQDPRAIEGLLPVQANQNGLAALMIESLAPYRGEKIVDALIAALAESDLDGREAAAGALGRQGDARAVPALLQAVRTDTTRVRLKAIRSLGELKDTQAITPLIAALAEPGTRIKTAAAAALQDITGQDFGEDPAKWRQWWEANGKQ